MTVTDFPTRRTRGKGPTEGTADVIPIGIPKIDRKAESTTMPILSPEGTGERATTAFATQNLWRFGPDDPKIDFSALERNGGPHLPVVIDQPKTPVPLVVLEDVALQRRKLAIANMRFSAYELEKEIVRLIRETDGSSRRIPALKNILATFDSGLTVLEQSDDSSRT